MLGRSSVIVRNFSQSMVRMSGHGGVPGENLPFGLTNKYRITALFTIGTVLGFGSPFLIVRHQLLKK
ncbi:cytochrome c oxidase subunit 7C, mitochondrial [Drosophila ficusphila]|uniref:cytochrome c oxidase subunit 7C, mitochondrial n=1 Tax=Drosophila ficusphila TaxID=30025 RepID=UPI0007E69ED3|nr:cytochrome c oxidase subunit 7C, mitochondrial [Drosophila ficusphila]XP_017049985.1 cytochrome c oxidase subunit 7C, mitochondrial [Drosophila ficusphila]